MPQFETYQSGDNAELTLKPSKGDLRLMGSNTLEVSDGYGGWTYIGDIYQMINDITLLKNDVDHLQVWKELEDAKKNDMHRNMELEEKFADLSETGKYLRQIEDLAKTARQELKNLEESVGKARRAYMSLENDTKQKLQTFTELDKPYPESDANKTGYSI